MSNEEISSAPEASVPEPVANDRRAEIINQILILLGFVGIFIAGFLSYAKMQNVLIPCAAGSTDCAVVDNSPMAMLFGNIYVGYVGLAGYLILTGLSIARGFLAGRDWSTFVKAGLLFSGVGFIFSVFLTFYAIVALQAKCTWCISSAVVMTAICALHYFLLARPAPAAPGRSPLLVAGVGLVLCAGLMGTFVSQAKASWEGSILVVKLGEGKSREDLLPRAEKISGGGMDAPVILVEFADFNCPACRGSYSAVHDAVTAAGPKLGYAYRNFPLVGQPGHETSLDAALVSEFAADQGKFADYVNEVFKPENSQKIKDAAGIIEIAASVGLDKGAVKAVLDGTHPKSSEYEDAVNEDISTARETGASVTPTFIVMAKGVDRIIAVPYNKLAEVFSTEPYKSLLQ